MKTKVLFITGLIFGFLTGIIFSAITISISAGDMMVKELNSPYDFDKTVDVLVRNINNAEGWHVTHIIDQNKAVKENGGSEIGNFKIIKYCHGKFAYKMLKDEERKKIGNMMPKSFAVYEKTDGSVYISTMNGAMIGKLFGGETEKIIEQSGLEVEGILKFINYKFTLF